MFFFKRKKISFSPGLGMEWPLGVLEEIVSRKIYPYKVGPTTYK